MGPLALRINKEVRDHKRMLEESNRPHSAFCLGIYAAPGSGKSTLVKLLVFLLKVLAERNHEELNVANVSSDDFYRAKANRTPGHNRLHVEEVDAELGVSVLTSLKTQWKRDAETHIPVFNKANDDREPKTNWPVVRGQVDLVLFEGWRVCIQHPLYAKMSKEVDFLIYLDSDLQTVRKQKVRSSREDKEAVGKLHEFDEAAVLELWDRHIQPDVELFAGALKKKANLVITKDEFHRIMNIDAQLREKIGNVFDLRSQSPSQHDRAMRNCD